MKTLIFWIVLVPVAGYFLGLLLPAKAEKRIAGAAKLTVGVQFILILWMLFQWWLGSSELVQTSKITIYQSGDYEFSFSFFFDKISAVYAVIGSVLTFLIISYCKYYLHREEGYKRFFCVLQLFYAAYNIIIFSGNFETLFLGWEVMGISSFLLITFYRDRYLPVKNGMKIFAVYRIGDVGLILAIWLAHHLFHSNITFEGLQNYQLVHNSLSYHSGIGIAISIALLVSASVKSAQFPFTYWLPRAMEGPTPSSAIFYGSLAVHLGAFLLMRTFVFWEHQYSIRILIVIMGLITSISGTLVARTQSSVKSQVAYSSSAQIGLIFVEIALGWENVALLHITGNAFLRCYQLLITPSMVSYKIREQFYHPETADKGMLNRLNERWSNTVYLWSLKEWNLEYYVNKLVWNPLKTTGDLLNTFRPELTTMISGLLVLFLAGISVYYDKALFFIPGIIAFIGLSFVLRAYVNRKNAFRNWNYIFISHLIIALAISLNKNADMEHLLIYLSGIVIFYCTGAISLYYLQQKIGQLNLIGFKGEIKEYPMAAIIFFLSCLGMAGFPVSATFIGEDLLFYHLYENQYVLAFLLAVSYIMTGLCVIRIYTRIYFGTSDRSEVPGARRSA